VILHLDHPTTLLPHTIRTHAHHETFDKIVKLSPTTNFRIGVTTERIDEGLELCCCCCCCVDGDESDFVNFKVKSQQPVLLSFSQLLNRQTRHSPNSFETPSFASSLNIEPSAAHSSRLETPQSGTIFVVLEVQATV
jgi:hypothetical protein